MATQNPGETDDHRFWQTHLSRRALLRSLVAAGLVGPVLAACGGKSSKSSGTNAQQPPQPQAPTALPNLGASPSATTTQGAENAPGTIGKLVVRTEPYPKYTGTKVDSELLTIIRSEDLSQELSPAALNVYSPFTFVYDPLLWMDEYTLEPKPWLAKSWEISPDGKSYTYHLRDDVKWHDGTPFTADDVAFSMIVYRDDIDSGVARFFPLMKKDPVVVDPYTIRFDLDSPSGDWILNASNQFMIQKKQFIDYWNAAKGAGGKKTLDGFPYTSSMLIGTGPWKQAQFNPSAAPPNIQYLRNDNYWVEKPHFKKFIFQEADKTETQVTDWLSGNTDLLWPATFPEVQQVKDQDGWLYDSHALAFMNAWINFKNPKSDHPDFLKDKNVRQALSTGIDRNGYAQAVFGGFVNQSAVGSVALPWGYDTSLKSPVYDATKAQQMLADAGYKKDSSGNLVGSDGKPIKLVAITATANQYPVDKIAVSVQEDFRKLGVDMQIDTQDTATIKKRWQTQYDYDLYFVSRVLFPGFSDYNYYKSDWDVRTNKQGRNYGGWSNPQADTLLDQIIREPDLTKQTALLHQFQAIIADDLPALWFGFPSDLILVKKNILGYQPNVGWQYWNTWAMWRTAG